MSKSKDIQFFATQLSNIDRDIRVAKRLCKLPIATLKIYNGSGEKEEIHIWQDLKNPLADFLVKHFDKEKQKIYKQIDSKLQDNR